MPQHLTVRRAKPADLHLLIPLFEGYRAFYRCAPDAGRAKAFLSERLTRGDSVVFIAPDNATARRLYESLGYRAEGGFMQYVLDLEASSD